MSDQLLIAALLLDAQGEFHRIVEHIPDSGRSEAIGPLNTPAWIVAHAVSAHDSWFTASIQQQPEAIDAFATDFRTRQREAGDTPVAVDLDEAIEASQRVFERTTAYLNTCTAEELARIVAMQRPGSETVHVAVGWLVGRSVAHLMAHAGELSVIATLAGADDASLPGRMPNARATTVDGGSAPLTSRLLLDARDAFEGTVATLPESVRAGSVEPGKLNSASFIIAHVAEREDHVWNVASQGLPRDTWLDEAGVGYGAERTDPGYTEALEAFQRTVAASNPHIEAMSHADLQRTITVYERDATVAAQLARSAAHIWMHAGELGAIGSLHGVPDMRLPGMLPHTAEA